MYRPGPLDTIPSVIAAKQNSQSIHHSNAKIAAILAETYGALVYQEQLMSIFEEVYGIDLARADTLRRIMGKKKAEDLNAAQDECRRRALARGMDATMENSIFDLLVRGSVYTFSKSHAVAYTKIAWQCAYLKANYPREYRED